MHRDERRTPGHVTSGDRTTTRKRARKARPPPRARWPARVLDAIDPESACSAHTPVSWLPKPWHRANSARSQTRTAKASRGTRVVQDADGSSRARRLLQPQYQKTSKSIGRTTARTWGTRPGSQALHLLLRGFIHDPLRPTSAIEDDRDAVANGTHVGAEGLHRTTNVAFKEWLKENAP